MKTAEIEKIYTVKGKPRHCEDGTEVYLATCDNVYRTVFTVIKYSAEHFKSEEQRRYFSERCREWASLRQHPNILYLYDYTEPDKNGAALILNAPEMPDPDHDIIDKPRSIEEGIDLCFAGFEALKSIHSHKLPDGEQMVHGHISSRCFFDGLHRKALAGLADLGYDRRFLSPEQVRLLNGEDLKLTPACDIYSLALLIVRMFTVRQGWHRSSEIFDKTGEIIYNADSDLKKQFGRGFKLGFIDLLASCLEKDPQLRPSAAEVLRKLTAIYSDSAPKPVDLGDPIMLADTLNLRAMRALNSNDEDKMWENWNDALGVRPDCFEAQFNRSMYQWSKGIIDSQTFFNRLMTIPGFDAERYGTVFDRTVSPPNEICCIDMGQEDDFEVCFSSNGCDLLIHAIKEEMYSIYSIEDIIYGSYDDEDIEEAEQDPNEPIPKGEAEFITQFPDSEDPWTITSTEWDDAPEETDHFSVDEGDGSDGITLIQKLDGIGRRSKVYFRVPECHGLTVFSEARGFIACTKGKRYISVYELRYYNDPQYLIRDIEADLDEGADDEVPLLTDDREISLKERIEALDKGRRFVGYEGYRELNRTMARLLPSNACGVSGLKAVFPCDLSMGVANIDAISPDGRYLVLDVASDREFFSPERRHVLLDTESMRYTDHLFDLDDVTYVTEVKFTLGLTITVSLLHENYENYDPNDPDDEGITLEYFRRTYDIETGKLSRPVEMSFSGLSDIKDLPSSEVRSMECIKKYFDTDEVDCCRFFADTMQIFVLYHNGTLGIYEPRLDFSIANSNDTDRLADLDILRRVTQGCKPLISLDDECDPNLYNPNIKKLHKNGADPDWDEEGNIELWEEEIFDEYSKPSPEKETYSADEKHRQAIEEIAGLTMMTEVLREKLSAKVKGQEEAVNAVCDGIFSSELLNGIEDKSRPKAIFTFAGPPGVGKTFLAKQTAKLLGREFKEFSMTNFTNDDMASQLIGSNSEFVDSGPGELTAFVFEHPDCVLLFDEIEKAHPKVLQLFYDLLDNGKLTDEFYRKLDKAKPDARDPDKLEKYNEELTKLGGVVSFKDTIIIFTTNAGRDIYKGEYKKSFSHISRETVLSALTNDRDKLTGNQFFPSALISRIATGYTNAATRWYTM